ncbi:MAG: helix-turn-helix domain-containing protein [Candidatus Aenigmarchaeota archaeon]
MKNFFDTMILDILPSLRAVMAKKLMENGFSQKEIGELLGLSQSAISHYKRDVRGYRKDAIEGNPKLLDRVNSLVREIASARMSPKDANLKLFDICREMIESSA